MVCLNQVNYIHLSSVNFSLVTNEKLFYSSSHLVSLFCHTLYKPSLRVEWVREGWLTILTGSEAVTGSDVTMWGDELFSDMEMGTARPGIDTCKQHMYAGFYTKNKTPTTWGYSNQFILNSILGSIFEALDNIFHGSLVFALIWRFCLTVT